MKRAVGLLSMLSFWLIASPAHAVELDDGHLSINGFGRWAYGRNFTKTDDRYLTLFNQAQPEGNYENGQFALATSYRISDDTLVAAQLNFEIFAQDSIQWSLDWAYGEHRFNEHLRVHAGRFKHAFGLFGEVLQVGTLDPFLALPTGVYGVGFSEMAARGVQGIGANGLITRSGDWLLSYDVYFGGFELTSTHPYEALVDPTIYAQPYAGLTFLDEELTNVGGGRLVLNTPIDGLNFRVSGYATNKKLPSTKVEGIHWVVGPSVEYVGERLSVRAEFFHMADLQETPTAVAYHLSVDTGYVELAYFITEHLQAAGRGELYQTHVDGVSDASALTYHRELALGLNWWFSRQLVAKVSVHGVGGNRFSTPYFLGDALRASDLSPHTLTLLAGMQFSF